MKNSRQSFFVQVLKIAIPIILAGIIQSLVGFVDNIVVASSKVHDGLGPGLNKIDLKSAGVGNEIFFLFSALSLGATVLFGSFYAQFKKTPAFFETFKINLYLMTVLNILASFVMFCFAKELVGLFFNIHTSIDKSLILKHATNFVKIMALSLFFYALVINLLNPLTILGKVKYSLYLSLWALCINLLLDLLFIFYYRWGCEGAAWATLIAYFSQFLITIFLIHQNKDLFCIKGKHFSFNTLIFKKIIKRILIWCFFIIQQSSWAIATILWSSLYGSKYIAGLTTGYIVANLMFIIFPATTKVIAIFIGPLLGSNQMAKAKIMSWKLFKPCFFICLVTMALAAIVTLFFPSLMLGHNKSSVWEAQWVIIVFILLLPGYMGVGYFSAMFQTGGLTVYP